MKKIKLATVLLGDGSDCYTSCLDLDAWLMDLAVQVDLVYCSFADIKAYPEGVDIALVEGTVSNKADLELIKKVRDRSKILISYGDCATLDNSDALRNLIDETESILQPEHLEAADRQNLIPQESETLSNTLEQLLSVHTIVDVDVYLSGCPPNPSHVCAVLELLLGGEIPHLAGKLDEFC